MTSHSALKWARFNLFAKPFDTVLSLIVIPVLLWSVYAICHWAVSLADWEVIRSSIKVLMTGVFPAEELWRAWLAAGGIGMILALTATSAVPVTGKRIATAIGGVAALVLLAASISPSAAINTLLAAGIPLLVWILGARSSKVQAHSAKLSAIVFLIFIALLFPVGASTWGGLLLSVVLTLCAAVLTIPVGVALAFGRRSKIGSIRTLSTAYIEVMRAVPLILVVYLIWISQPLLLPGLAVPDVVRGLIGFVLFYSAYAAEYIRSGLQAVPRGQVEAAEALGFSDLDVKRYVILPQAMRVAMPGLVGNTLDIFNYAPLVFIIGLTDFLRAGQMVLANPQNSGQTYEVYAFLFLTYFVIGSMITFMARRLESHFGKGSQR